MLEICGACSVYGVTGPAGLCNEQLIYTPGGVLQMQALKTHLLRTQSSKVLLLKPGADPYTAMLATPTARDFFLANFYPSSHPSFSCVGCD